MRVRNVISIFLLLLSTAAFANEESKESHHLSLRGFGTLGLARSSSDNAEFIRDLSQTHGIKGGKWSGRIDSIFGLQANLLATPEWEFVGQAVSRLHYDKSRNPELMLALAKWEPNEGATLRFGRLGADFMMRADSRLVGYSFLPVRPSGDFFGPLFFSHLDGADVVLGTPVGAGILRGKVFLGKTHEKAAGTPGIWDTSGSPIHGWVLDYTVGNWQLRANAAQIRYANEIKKFDIDTQLRTAGAIAAADSMIAKDKAARFLSFGVVYEDGPLQVQGMVNRIRQESKVFEDSHAAYLLAGYRLNHWTPYAGVSYWKSKAETYAAGSGIAALDAAYSAYMSGSRADQQTYTLGARWDVWTNMAFKFQYDAVRGKPASKFPFATSNAQWNGRTDVLSMTMDFVF